MSPFSALKHTVVNSVKKIMVSLETIFISKFRGYVGIPPSHTKLPIALVQNIVPLFLIF